MTLGLHQARRLPLYTVQPDAAWGIHFMGDVVNLNKYRKAKQRESDARAAEINREKFGRNKAQTAQDRLQRRQEEKALDGKKLDDGSDKT